MRTVDQHFLFGNKSVNYIFTLVFIFEIIRDLSYLLHFNLLLLFNGKYSSRKKYIIKHIDRQNVSKIGLPKQVWVKTIKRERISIYIIIMINLPLCFSSKNA